MGQIMTITKNLNQSQNKVIVSMGHDQIETNITLSKGNGCILPDPSVVGPYNIIWWNASDYESPTGDPFVEIVKCIAKMDDTMIVMRSQQQTSASPKNISGKLYNMTRLPDSNLDALSYYNIPQTHGSIRHDATVETPTGSQAKVDTHAGYTTAHGSTSTATASAIIQRDAAGRAKVAAPSAIDDIARKDTIDTVQTNLNNHANGTNTHAQIDTALTASNGHIAASGTSVHGLGTMSIQNANSVAITGGTITGVTGISGGWTLITKAFVDSPFMTASDNTILCNAAGGNMIINLPAAASNANKIYNIKKIDSSGNSITIDANASETIDGTITKSLNTQYESITIQCDGANWYIL